MEFAQPDLWVDLVAASDDALDALPFGVIKMDAAERVLAYNRFESVSAGLRPETVIGRSFFEEVAPCMDNDLVAMRLRRELALDVQMDYVFALRLRPEPVRLRLLKAPSAPVIFLLVERGRHD